MLALQEHRQLWQLEEKDAVNWDRREKSWRTCRKQLEHFSQAKFPSWSGMAKLSWRTFLDAWIQPSALFSLLRLCMSLLSPSVMAMAECKNSPAYSLTGEHWASSMDFSLSCFLQPGTKFAATSFTLYTERMKVRKIILPAPFFFFFVEETEEML